jgi:hypothetical protein
MDQSLIINADFLSPRATAFNLGSSNSSGVQIQCEKVQKEHKNKYHSQDWNVDMLEDQILKK